MPFQHDSTGLDPDGGIALLPERWYQFRIYEAEEMKSKQGNDMVLTKCEIVDHGGEYDGETIWHYVTFLPKENKGAGISVKFRKSIGVPYGGNDTIDADDWVGKKFDGYVKTETYTDKKGKSQTKSKISFVRSLEEVAAGAVATSNGHSQNIDEEVPF